MKIVAGMERLELSNPGLKNLLRGRFAFIPTNFPSFKDQCGRGESNSQELGFKPSMSAGCITPAFGCRGRIRTDVLMAYETIAGAAPVHPASNGARGESRTHDDLFCRQAPCHLATRAETLELRARLELALRHWQCRVPPSGPTKHGGSEEIRTLKTGVLSAGCLPVASRSRLIQRVIQRSKCG